MWINFRCIPIEFDGRPRGFTLEDSRSNQPVPVYTCVSTTGKQIYNEQLNILTYWSYWTRKPMTFLSSPSFARSWGVLPRNTTQLRKPNLRNFGCAIPAICSGPWKARPWKVRPWNQESKTTIDCLFCFQGICVFKRNQHLQFCAHFLGNPLTLMNLLVQLILQNSSRQIKTS